MQRFLWNLSNPDNPNMPRGYWATNFSNSSSDRTIHPWSGFMLHSGNGRVYKTSEGWRAAWSTKSEVKIQKIISEVNKITMSAARHGQTYHSYKFIVEKGMPKIQKLLNDLITM
jgi:hypothetical protein